MKIVYLLFLFLVPLNSFNITTINEFAKKYITNSSKILSLYSLNKFTNSVNDTDEQPHKHEVKKTNHYSGENMENTLYFYSPITEESSLGLQQKLITLDRYNQKVLKTYNVDNGPIHLHIQSFGGSLFHTLYLIDLIKGLKTPVYTYVDGFAASAATLLSVVGKKRFMTKHSLMLIHQLSGGGGGGKYSEIKDEEQNVDMLMDIIVDTYLENTKFNEMTLNNILKHDWWLTSDQCLKYGLVDEIL